MHAGDTTIENYSKALFNKWGIGYQDRNYGTLLLASIGDRKARIELGQDWAQSYYVKSQEIMNTLIIPEFKKENYANGILQGVKGIDAMTRGLNLPPPVQPWWVIPACIAAIIFCIDFIISLFRSGRKGWGWAFIVLLGFILWTILRGGSRGAFGGGSSKGGGATGSW
jgi:uncharacterized protein